MPSKQPSNPPQPDITRTIEETLRTVINFKQAAIDKAQEEGIFEVDIDRANKILDQYIDEAVQKLVTLVNKSNEEYLETHAHSTKDGWCCACGYDLAVMERKVNEEANKLYALTEVDRYDGLSKQQKKILLDYHTRAIKKLSQ